MSSEIGLMRLSAGPCHFQPFGRERGWNYFWFKALLMRVRAAAERGAGDSVFSGCSACRRIIFLMKSIWRLDSEQSLHIKRCIRRPIR
jgi:hypothetical protein